MRGVESDPEKVLKQWITIGYHIDRFLFFKLSQKFRESKVDVLYINRTMIFLIMYNDFLFFYNDFYFNIQ